MKTKEQWIDRAGKTWPVKIRTIYGRPVLVHFGAGGDTIYFARQEGGGARTCSGYRDRKDFFAPSRWWTHEHAERENPEPFDGVPWVDCTEAVETPEGRQWVFAGPLVDVELPDGEREACPTDGFAPVIAAAWGMLGAMAAGGLDSVSIAEYVRGWAEHGAKVGVIRGGQFVEERGEK